MPSDFAQNFLAGAQVGNMMAQRRERSIQLRQEQALQAIKERQLSAEAEMLTQHAQYYHQLIQAKQQEAQEDTAVDLATKDLFQGYKQTMPEEDAAKRALLVAAAKFPRYAQKLTTGFENVARGQATISPPPTAQQAQDQKDLATHRQKYLYGTEVDNLPPAQAKANADEWLKANNPGLAEKMTRAQANEARAGASTAQADFSKARADSLRTGKGPTGQLSAAGKYAQELKAARMNLEMAYDSGDEGQISEAEQGYKDLQDAMEKLHPDKRAVTKATMLMSKWRETYRAYLAGDKKLKPEADRLEQEIRASGQALDKNNETQSAPTESEGTKTIGGFKVRVKK